MINFDHDTPLITFGYIDKATTYLPRSVATFFGVSSPDGAQAAKLEGRVTSIISEDLTVNEEHLDFFVRVLRDESGVQAIENNVKQVIDSLSHLVQFENQVDSEPTTGFSIKDCLGITLISRMTRVSVQILGGLISSFFSAPALVVLIKSYESYLQNIQKINNDLTNLTNQIQEKKSKLDLLKSKPLQDKDKSWDRFFADKLSLDDVLKQEKIHPKDLEKYNRELESNILNLSEAISHKQDEFLTNQTQFIKKTDERLSTIQMELLSTDNRDLPTQVEVLKQINEARSNIQNLSDLKATAKELRTKYGIHEEGPYFNYQVWSDVKRALIDYYKDPKESISTIIQSLNEFHEYIIKNPSIEMIRLGQDLQLLSSLISDESSISMIRKQIKINYLLQGFSKGLAERSLKSDPNMPPDLRRYCEFIHILPTALAVIQGINQGSSLLPLNGLAIAAMAFDETSFLTALLPLGNMALGVKEKLNNQAFIRNVSEILSVDERKNLMLFLNMMQADYDSLEELERAYDTFQMIGEGFQIAQGNIEIPSTNFLMEALEDFRIKMKYSQSNWERLVRIMVQIVIPIIVISVTILGIASIFTSVPVLSIIGAVALFGGFVTLGGEAYGLYRLVKKVSHLLDHYVYKDTLLAIEAAKKEEDAKKKVQLIEDLVIRQQREIAEKFVKPMHELIDKMLALGKYDQEIEEGARSLEDRRVAFGELKKEQIAVKINALVIEKLNGMTLEKLEEGVNITIDINDHDIRTVIFANEQVKRTANSTQETYQSALLRAPVEVREIAEGHQEILVQVARDLRSPALAPAPVQEAVDVPIDLTS